jgi:chorismate synthase
MSVGVNSINRVSKQKIDTTEKVAPATTAKKKAKTSKAKPKQVQMQENSVGNKVYCLTEELPYYLL